MSNVNLFGFQSSSHISLPTQVSSVDKTTSPNGTVVFNKTEDNANLEHHNRHKYSLDMPNIYIAEPEFSTSKSITLLL